MKILLVRLSSMGDLVHTLPAVSDLAHHCPDIELHWLCEAAFADFARLHPFVRRVETMQWRKWRKHLFQAAVRREIGSLKTVLRAESYDAVLDSQGLLKSALFARRPRARAGLAFGARAGRFAVLRHNVRRGKKQRCRVAQPHAVCAGVRLLL